MRERNGEADVAEPVVKREELRPAKPRPLANRVVTDREQEPEENLRGKDAHRNQPGDRRDVDRGGQLDSVHYRCGGASVVARAPAFFTYRSNQFTRSASTCSSVSRAAYPRSEEHTSELQSHSELV